MQQDYGAPFNSDNISRPRKALGIKKTKERYCQILWIEPAYPSKYLIDQAASSKSPSNECQGTPAKNEKGSVMITTSLEFSKWTELFPDPMLAAARIDRITHRSHILDMNGASYRLSETKRRKAKESGSI